MRVAGIVRDSTVDGEGVRDVVFLQGCGHHCKGCHNPQTWNMNGGTHMFAGQVLDELADSSNDITISGGEPMLQYEALLSFLMLVKTHTSKRVWLYTGNIVDVTKDIYRRLSHYVDVIVDGRFIEDLKDESLLFRGSSNQRLIDLPKSVEANEIIEWVSEYE